MYAKKFLYIFLIIAVLLAVVRAQEDKEKTEASVEVASAEKKEDAASPAKAEETKETSKAEEPSATTPKAEESKPTQKAEEPAPTTPKAEEPKPTPKAEEPKQNTPAPETKTQPQPQPQPPKQNTPSPQPTKSTTQQQPTKQNASAPVQQAATKQSTPQASKNTSSTQQKSGQTTSNTNNAVKGNTTTGNTTAATKTTTEDAPANEAPANDNAPANNAPANNAAAVNPIAPSGSTNNNNNNNKNKTSNIAKVTDNNSGSQSENNGGSNGIKTALIGVTAVGAVVGVATVGVRVYNKRTNNTNKGFDLGDMEEQPINKDFGKSNDELSGMGPEDYNPYNIMSDLPNEPYNSPYEMNNTPYETNNTPYDTNNNTFEANSPYETTNNPYEYKPSYDQNIIDTTPFQKAETNQDNFMSRESIFSNPGNIPQIGNDVFNFNDNSQLPYVQDLPVENSYLEQPVANSIEVENYNTSAQMPTLVPVQPEIVITQPEEEPAQEGYKQIVPNVAQMEIIETPDFNNMTTSMIEDHINNMDLENLANTETQDETDTGYKQIVPDIQEAVIENFDIDDDEEDQDISVVDNITDTYRAALRATYCSTTDENRFSYRTVDSDHSLLHTMREDGQW